MARKGENIHKRKDGRWEGRYKKGRREDGTIIYGSVYGKTYREVKEKMAKAVLKAEYINIPHNREHSFKEVLILWMENNRIRYKGATEARYQYLIDTHINPELGAIKISQLSAPTINAFLKRKLEKGRVDGTGGLSSAYVRNIMLIISAAIKFAVEEQMCLPLKSAIFKPTDEQKEFMVFDIDQQKKFEMQLLNEMDATKLGVLISLHTGLRIGEICALTWENVDIAKKIIYVRTTVARVKNDSTDGAKTKLIIDSPKTKSSKRDIPISSFLLPILTTMKSLATSPYVISEEATFIQPRTYEYRYHKLLDSCGLESINYHSLRHTFATRCIEAGVDVKSLSEILGHSNVSITLNTYVHSSMELKRTQLEKLTTLCA